MWILIKSIYVWVCDHQLRPLRPGASLAGTFARQTGRVFVFAYRHVPCPWGAPVERLNLLARFALIPPDVGIEIRKVSPVHCLRSLTLCARVAALQLHQSLKFNPSPSPFWRQVPSCLKMSWIIKRLLHTSCREGRWKYGRRWALAWPELGQLGSIWTPECCTKMSGGRICETFPAHRGAQILSDDVEFVSTLNIRPSYLAHAGFNVNKPPAFCNCCNPFQNTGPAYLSYFCWIFEADWAWQPTPSSLLMAGLLDK